MRKTPKQRYKHTYNVGYRAGKKFALNGNGRLLKDIPLEVPTEPEPFRPIDKWIKLLSLLKEVA